MWQELNLIIFRNTSQYKGLKKQGLIDTNSIRILKQGPDDYRTNNAKDELNKTDSRHITNLLDRKTAAKNV